jgi:2-dehydro-3-deoxygluconokinase
MINWDKVFEGATCSIDWNYTAIAKEQPKFASKQLKLPNARGITVSTDLNFRKNLWKYGKKASDVMPELVEGCDVILGNEEDAEMVFGIKPQGVDVTKGHVEAAAYQSVCEQLMKRFPRAKKVIVTLRGSVNANHNTWSGVLWDGKQLFKAPDYNITHIVDRVGGGDSLWWFNLRLLTYTGNDQKALTLRCCIVF